MHHVFETPSPVDLYVELGAGHLTIHADDVTGTTVDVEGRESEQVAVEQRGSRVVIMAPRRWTDLLGATDLVVTVTLPTGSALAAKLGSADLLATGGFGATRVRSGSGDVHIDELAGHAAVDTGSGAVEITAALSDLRVKSGSGDVRVGRVGGTAVVVTGSGDVVLGATERDVVVKSGSGDLHVGDAHTDVRLTTASGGIMVAAIRRGTVRARAVSGDVRVGVPRGIPVWTDASSISGDVASTLEGAGRPGRGQDFVEVRASTVSGSIRLEQLA
ncbi:DUF4097 family beta strand repeat-containing protein [Georgenia sp. SYP-B2076]|uniref:DUF4097 family beta strand repeat-containing protein n=1 Tax=Georgenia sp. SYP-B2076 TaxID=2495881 RepID=UPI000F8CD09F|nr:DUF4097 family beta strand repeat-containing protein [Georgenia sp. SYP-B2076]